MNLYPMAALTVVGAAICFRLGAMVQSKLNSHFERCLLWITCLALAVPSFLFPLYYTHAIDNVVWFYRFRTLQFGVGFLAGAFYSWFAPETLTERLAAPVVTLLLVSVPFLKPILQPIDLDRLSNQSSGGVCLQSTQSTCGPSSAATILRAFGKTASERELAHECLTSRGGTEIWYVARAFRRRGFVTDFVVQAPLRGRFPSPAIAGVLLPGGAGHFIAILDESDNVVTVADPLKGKFTIGKAELQRSYAFTGFFLEIQRGSGAMAQTTRQ
jgi:hypothetical protein